ncbi:quinoprotein dehydrogenase-associated SoxYZ-like carrier [Chromatiales bacterium (ex Bugula neritina AB1)]|nr:quinoprotein dehydrogenase-associated SoxYZ-like carrier [Chromatiales bacterium (ex Bugula neritina AB1)]
MKAHRHTGNISFFFHGIFLIITSLLAQTAAAQQSAADLWETALRPAIFGDREIQDAGDLLRIEAPKRAEDPALVPVKIVTGTEQQSDRYIKRITLLIDKNPDPKAGTFTFTPASGRADLDLRVRVDQYSHIRAIAETSDGKLFMASRFVKGSGGCSAPAAGNLALAMERLGRMQLKTRQDEPTGLLAAQLKVSHPNITGMQKDQVTHLYYPAHYVRNIDVKLDDTPIFSAEVGISISENPTFRFYLKPEQSGRLIAEVTDSEKNVFIKDAEIAVRGDS